MASAYMPSLPVRRSAKCASSTCSAGVSTTCRSCRSNLAQAREPAGFLVGDIIYSINKQLTRNFRELLAIVDGNGKGMIMNIQRGNRELYILLK